MIIRPQSRRTSPSLVKNEGMMSRDDEIVIVRKRRKRYR